MYIYEKKTITSHLLHFSFSMGTQGSQAKTKLNKIINTQNIKGSLAGRKKFLIQRGDPYKKYFLPAKETPPNI